MTITAHSLPNAMSMSLLFVVYGIFTVASMYWVASGGLAGLGRARFMSGATWVARWIYSKDEWDSHFKHNALGYFGSAREILTFGAVACSPTVLGWILWQESGESVFLFGMAGMTGGTLAAILLGRLARIRRMRRLPGEAAIAESGLVIGDELHIWNGGERWLERVEVVAGRPACLSFTYTFRTDRDRLEKTVLVPIPTGRDSEAANVVLHFATKALAKGTRTPLARKRRL
jgi:hypothetical protein